jgi:hypothetical protein
MYGLLLYHEDRCPRDFYNLIEQEFIVVHHFPEPQKSGLTDTLSVSFGGGHFQDQ